MSDVRASRRVQVTAASVYALLVGGWVLSSLLYLRFHRYSDVVQATNAITTAAFTTSRATHMALEGSPVAQRQVDGANTVIERELARLADLDWDLHDLRIMRDLHGAVLEIESALAQPMGQARRDFLNATLRVGLGRMTSAATSAHAAALGDREQTVRTLFFLHSATFAAAIAALVVAVLGYTRQQRDHDRYERTLRNANELLRVRADEMEQIVYVASHDLKEPLRMVNSYTDLLERHIGATLGDRDRRYLEQVRKGATRMQLLVDDLLRLAVIDQDPAPPQEFSAKAEVDEIVGMFRADLDAIGGEIAIGPLPRLEVGRSRFSQLMQNLVGNAIKYRDPSRPLRIAIAAEADGADWRFVIEDNGIGVPSEHREVVFKLFRRLHGREIEGTGAGLAICRKIVDGWGGRIWVEPAAGHGSRFGFTVPARAVRAADGNPA